MFNGIFFTNFRIFESIVTKIYNTRLYCSNSPLVFIRCLYKKFLDFKIDSLLRYCYKIKYRLSRKSSKFFVTLQAKNLNFFRNNWGTNIFIFLHTLQHSQQSLLQRYVRNLKYYIKQNQMDLSYKKFPPKLQYNRQVE